MKVCETRTWEEEMKATRENLSNNFRKTCVKYWPENTKKF
jgi:hypothetical protein